MGCLKEGEREVQWIYPNEELKGQGGNQLDGGEVLVGEP